MKKTLKVVLVFLGIMSIIIANNIAIAATGKVNDNNIRIIPAIFYKRNIFRSS